MLLTVFSTTQIRITTKKLYFLQVINRLKEVLILLIINLPLANNDICA